MSSSQPFVDSSPVSLTAGTHRRKSRFTFKHLNLLSQSSTSCPLRVIAHIDLDAFYAQCEMVRLGVAEDQPLAVRQWQMLIAINYPAREFGLNRHITITEAKKLCPNLIMQHVATWKEGDEKWAYHEDAFAHIATHKVSLDPYRLESRKIFATIKDVLPPAPVQRVEKASIDEVFLDLSAQIHPVLLEKYPELKGPPPYDDPSGNLPPPPTTVLDWKADALVDLDSTETEDDDPDWDDIAMLIGSDIVRSVRLAIRERLRYTCSAGVARNKMMAKLGSGHKKPNQQTVIRNRAIQHFLSGFKFTKVRNLGGKLGEQVVSTFGTDDLTELLKVSMDLLKAKIGDDTGSWLYQTIRGEDHSEVNSRTQIKSMLSAKSFSPSINTFEQAVKWLRIFVADIYARLVEEGVVENKRRPKTINLHHRQGGQTRSRQAPIPSGRPIDEAMLLDLSKNLLGQVIVDGRAWPCANLSLSVGGFEDGVAGNRGIGSFLVRGEGAKSMKNSPTDLHEPPTEEARPEKRRKVGTSGIQQFFSKQESTEEHDDDFGSEHRTMTIGEDDALVDSDTPEDIQDPDHTKSRSRSLDAIETAGDPAEKDRDDTKNPLDDSAPPQVSNMLHQQSITSYFCEKCGKSIPVTQREEHHDWHFAKDLQVQERSNNNQGVRTDDLASKNGGSIIRPSSSNSNGKSKKPSAAATRGGRGKTDKGQRRLAFGR